jgi:hypothetical protein
MRKLLPQKRKPQAQMSELLPQKLTKFQVQKMKLQHQKIWSLNQSRKLQVQKIRSQNQTRKHQLQESWPGMVSQIVVLNSGMVVALFPLIVSAYYQRVC